MLSPQRSVYGWLGRALQRLAHPALSPEPVEGRNGATSTPAQVKASRVGPLIAYEALGQPTTARATHLFGDFDPDSSYQFLLVWITKMPKDGDAGYHIGIQEISVAGP